jgi:outer membrane lipoprotein-sorting protein
MKKLLLFLIIAVQLLSAQSIQNAEGLITAMHSRYSNKWYKTLSYVQKTTQYREDTTIVTWYETFSFPGTMRIDQDSVGSNGIIISNDSLYVIREGKLSSTRHFVHSLLLLGFDVYFLEPTLTLAKLRAIGPDLSVFREDTWQGRQVYVVGGKSDDLHSPQFWIDKERLYFVRMLEPAGATRKQTRETQFNKYVRLAGGWIAVEVIFKVDDKVMMTEEYSDLRANPKLGSNHFDPSYFQSTKLR